VPVNRVVRVTGRFSRKLRYRDRELVVERQAFASDLLEVRSYLGLPGFRNLRNPAVIDFLIELEGSHPDDQFSQPEAG